MKQDVLIVMGSDSDLPVMETTAKLLDEFNIPYHMTVSSAHRTPDRTLKIIKQAEKNGVQVIIAGAGAAAHLAGVIASHTILPVIGVPIDSSPLKGMDALYSTVQMPPGIPVATMAVGKAGAKNAAIFAAQILSLKDSKIAVALKDHKKKMAREVAKKAKKVENI
ncbi:MAG TPA: 5-(carboxyamino)imidazole ribonucleotide mutase [Nitrospirae bacterium]|nr:N5-carboxyaminoimidazole ribonucleotide mutase [bacterium BMS3Abin06]HDH12006.1 5-(carboxyamino)imidazole ribonucleotide mutase [Nitrospirota bacterium]HDZ02213.1 5-(carboxyamino)imidazole ribonucleotide mutase [Nitrospirota bacterium]